MIKTFKILAVLFFLSSGMLYAAAIWYTNWRLFFIGLLAMGFSWFSVLMTDVLTTLADRRKAATAPTIEELFRNLDRQTLDKLEE